MIGWSYQAELTFTLNVLFTRALIPPFVLYTYSTTALKNFALLTESRNTQYSLYNDDDDDDDDDITASCP